MTTYGIVGSRRYTKKRLIEKMIDTFEFDDVVISGGCKGPDTWAIEYAKKRGLKTIEYLPKLSKAKTRQDYISAYHTRNALISLNCDRLLAFVMSDRKGGTENTIGWARKFNKPVWTHIEEVERPKKDVEIIKQLPLMACVA